ncbi:MAG: hypothetical protein HC902_13965 [Calothrix sp. SM1_5_4]|nr:hypothetical protein [Calothrix sp. SM1_5_4]
MPGDQGSSQVKRDRIESCVLWPKYLFGASALFPLLSVAGSLLGIPLLSQGHAGLPAVGSGVAVGLLLGVVAFF